MTICKELGCLKQAIYNLIGLKPKYCKTHKTDDMIDVNNKRCIEVGCLKMANFNLVGLKAKYCSIHKTVSMIDVKNKRCVEPDCISLNPSFNNPSETVGIYCKLHAHKGMIDVVYPKCQIAGCNTHTFYGISGKSATHCTRHREENMLKSSTAKCIVDKCNKYATYGTCSNFHCELHKTTDDLCLIERKCSVCGVIHVLDNNICQYCDTANTHKAKLIKQTEIKDYFDQNNIIYSSYDRRIAGHVGIERPDFVFDSENHTHIIIVECDEHQHRYNKQIVEDNRMKRISNEYDKPVIYIRQNPDTYHNKNGIKLAPIKATRMRMLKLTLDKLKNLTLDELVAYGTCSYLRLYYDNFDKSNIIPTILID